MSGRSPARILLVEDNESLAFGFRTSLEVEGYDVTVVGDGREALEQAEDVRSDLVILDLMLPGLSGFHVLRELRAGGHDMPVLILTARGEEADKVQGFRLGADNYAVKPVGVLELLARVEALLKRIGHHRASAHPEPEAYEFGDVTVDVASRSIRRSTGPVDLTPMEFDLLVFLLRRAGAVVRRGDLLREVWGYKRAVATRTVDTHIAKLRTKLERDPAHPRHILTVRKVGYRVEP